MVPKAGLEPARGLSSVDFESTASTDFATSACVCTYYTIKSQSGEIGDL